MEDHDINAQIDRILSSNIRDQLLNHIPLQLLQSPCIQKKCVRNDMSSARSKQSFSKQKLQQDLYQKAQQIIKLKQTLQAELANINQIVQENQKLTEANLYLKDQLKKVKSEWKNFKSSIIKDINLSKLRIHQFQKEIFSALNLTNQKKQKQLEKMSIFHVFSIQNDLKSLILLKKQENKNLELSSQIFVQKFASQKILKESNSSQTDFNWQVIDDEVKDLKRHVQKLTNQNYLLKEKIESLKHRQKTDFAPDENTTSQNHIKNRMGIQCYSSVFLKSVFSEPQSPDELIRSALYSEQKPFFQELKEANYFGKMLFGKKNGNGFEQYKNGFHYEGNFSKNQRHGMGKLFYKDKLIYMGQWKKGKFYGKGTIFYYMKINVQKIQGNFKNGQLEGHSTITFNSGHKIRALFKNNNILEDSMFVPKQNNQNLLAQKLYTGKLRFQKTSQNEDQAIFITSTGKQIPI